MRQQIILLALLLTSILAYSQNQKINGTLTVASTTTIGENVLDKFGRGTELHFQGIYSTGDPIYIYRHSEKANYSDLRVNIGNDAQGDDRFSIGNIYWNSGTWRDWFTVTNRGYVGINGVPNPTSALEVNGTIRAKEVKIEATGWADFVFRKDYQLPSLVEVESHIKKYNTLPNIPSEQEVKENGVDLGDMQIKLLQKIEELTLYVIEQDRKYNELRKELDNLRNCHVITCSILK